MCPDGKVCDDTHVLCVEQEQLDACGEQTQFTNCEAVAGGRCYDGVCLVGGCGNGFVDPADPAVPMDVDERCDDGNRNAGDGCSADCKSEETCGNAVVDLTNRESCDDTNAVNHDGCSSTCSVEGARWLTLPGFLARGGHAMAYDSSRDRVVLFGGVSNGGTLLGSTFEHDGHRWHPIAPAQEPSPRVNAAMAFDASRKVTVLFGGSDGTMLSDTWEWDGARWRVIDTEIAPSPRFHHAMVYDSARERVILMGGAGPGGTLDDTWAWDGKVWTPLAAPGPFARHSHVMVYDPVRDVTVLFGGSSAAPMRDTWELVGSTWTQKSTASGPTSASYLSAAFDPVGDAPLVIDSANGAWRWNGSSWTATAGVWTYPDAAAVTDTTRKRVLALGKSADTWTFDGSTWTRQPSNNSSGPPPMFGFGVARDPSRRRVVIFGGTTQASVPLSTTWEWDGTWNIIDDVGGVPGPRFWPGFVYDEARATYLLFGGQTSTTTEVAATYSATDATNWIAETTPTALTGRFAPVMVYDAARANVVLFGGGYHDGDYADTWTWDGTWQQRTPAHAPSHRYRAAAAYDPIRQRVVVFGGFGYNAGTRGDTWEWDGTDWHDMAPTVAPPPRDGGAMAWDAARKRIVLLGGVDAFNGARDDAWEWDGTVWTQLATAQAPGARTDHGMFTPFDGGGVVAMRGGSFSNDAWSTVGGTVQLRRESDTPDETCVDGLDLDHDGIAGCADLDCWTTCTPSCPPGTTCMAPRCGDAACNPVVEDCASCPADCGPC